VSSNLCVAVPRWRDRTGVGRNDLARHGRKQRIRWNDLPTFEFTVLQHQRHPSGEIVCRRTDAARRRLRVGQTLILRLEDFADLHMPKGAVSARFSKSAKARAGPRSCQAACKGHLRKGFPSPYPMRQPRPPPAAVRPNLYSRKCHGSCEAAAGAGAPARFADHSRDLRDHPGVTR